MGDFSSPLFVVKRRIFVDYRKKQIRIIFLAWKKSICSKFVVMIQFGAHFTLWVDGVMAAAAADFLGLAKWLPAAYLNSSSSETKLHYTDFLN